MTSSASLQDTVAHKLSYYMTVKRREDDFDVSTRNIPVSPELIYLRSAQQPMGNFTRMQDRSLKHYFTPRMIRTQIAKLEAMPPGTQRERDVREKMVKTMKGDSFEDLALAPSEISTEAYNAQLKALKALKRDTSRRLYRKMDRSTSLTRRMMPPHMTRREANRIVDCASQILVATETVALAQDILNQEFNYDTKQRPQSAPIQLPSTNRNHSQYDHSNVSHGNTQQIAKRPRQRPKYCWDSNGRRVRWSTYYHEYSSLASSTTSLDQSDTSSYDKRRPVRPMSAKEPRRPLQQNGRHSLRMRPLSADVLYSSYTPRTPSSTRRGLSFRDQIYAIDIATQTVQDVGLQTDFTPKPPSDIRKYNIKVWTGDKSGAGTKADVYVVLHGKKCKTEEIFLTENVSGIRPFRRAQVDEFNIEAENVGKLKYLGIGHDQNERDFSWYIDCVEVKCGDEIWECPCKKWLSGKASDKKTFRYLRAKPASESAQSSVTSASSMRSRRSPHRPRGQRRRVSSASSGKTSRSRSSSSRSRSVERTTTKIAWEEKRTSKLKYSRRESSSSSSRSRERSKKTSSKLKRSPPSDRKVSSSSLSRSSDHSMNDRSSSHARSKSLLVVTNKEKKNTVEIKSKKSSSDTSGTESGKKEKARKQTSKNSSAIEYSSEGSSRSSTPHNEIVESIVEESVDSSNNKSRSSDSDSTITREIVGLRKDSVTTPKKVSGSESDSDSTITREIDGLRKEAIAITKKASSSESDISLLSSSSSKEDNHYHEVSKVAEEINESLDGASSFSADDVRNVRRGSVFEEYEAKQEKEKDLSSSDERDSQKRRLSGPPLKQINEDDSSSSSSDEDDATVVKPLPPVNVDQSIPVQISVEETALNQSKPDTKEVLSSSSSSDDEKEAVEHQPEAKTKPGYIRSDTVTKGEKSSSSSSESETEVREMEGTNLKTTTAEVHSQPLHLIQEDKKTSSSSSSESEGERNETKTEVRAVQHNPQLPILTAEAQNSFSSKSGDEREDNKKETKDGGISAELNIVPPALLNKERKSSSSSSSGSEIEEELEVEEESTTIPDAIDKRLPSMYQGAEDSSSSISEDEKVAEGSVVEKEQEEKLSIAKATEEFPPSLSMAFPIENTDLQSASVVDAKVSETAEVEETPTLEKKEASGSSDEGLSSDSDHSGDEMLSSSSSDEEAPRVESAVVHQEQAPPEENATLSVAAAKEFFESQARKTPKTAEDVATKAPVVASQLVQEDQHHTSNKTSSFSPSSSGDEDFVLSEHDIYHAIINDDIQRAREILEHHPHIVNDFGERDMTPFHFAAAHGKLRMLKFLASNSSNFNEETATGYTAMHLAAMNGHVECLKLIKFLGVGIESRNIEGQTPLHLAAIGGQLDAVKWLSLNGANCTAKDNAGRSVNRLAELNHHKDVMKFVVAYQRRTNPDYRPSSSSSSSSESSSSDSEDERKREVRTPVQREQEDLEAKKRMYEEHQHQVKKRKISFLDEIRMETGIGENDGL